MLFRIVILFLVSLSFIACKDDFSLEGEFQDVPTAYAFLNAEDDRHFVRVQKAFLEAGGNAANNAAIADSIYYGDDDATIILRNLSRIDSVELERVEAEQFGLDRDEGVFASSPNILYTVSDEDFNLSGGDDISLVVKRPGEDDAIATTAMLSALEITRPVDLAGIDDYRRQLAITWTKGENAAVYAVDIIFNIREFSLTDPSQVEEVALKWEVAKAYVPGPDEESGRTVTFRVDNESFYRFLGQNLEVDANLRRRFLTFDIAVTAAGGEILERRRLANANIGITSSQVTPTYTNLEGGLGLITSTSNTLLENIAITNSSTDSLRDGIYTRQLNF